MDKEKLLKSIVSDLIQNSTKKEWKTYSLETFGSAEYGENCRSVWKAFRKTFQPQGLWTGGIPIEESWKENVTRALALEKGSAVLDDAPEGFAVTKMFQQQNKAGDVIWLKSVEKNRDADAAKDFYDKSVEAFQNIVTLYEPTKIYLLPQNKPTNWGFNLLVSDAHVGATIKDSLFGEQYNKDVYLERVKSWMDVIEKGHQKFGTFKYLNIISNGDGLDGFNGYTTRGGHKLVQDLSNQEQFDLYVKSHIDFFHTLVQEGFAEKIRFIASTNSNHGGGFEYTAARAVEIFLNAKYPDIETIVSKNFIYHVISGKHVAVISHGKDQDHQKQSLPWILGKDNETWIENYINYHGLNKHIPFNQEKNFITLYTGDLHQTKTEYSKRFRYKRIMSMMGGTDFIEYNYSKGSGYKGIEWEIFDTDGPEIIEGRHFYL